MEPTHDPITGTRRPALEASMLAATLLFAWPIPAQQKPGNPYEQRHEEKDYSKKKLKNLRRHAYRECRFTSASFSGAVAESWFERCRFRSATFTKVRMRDVTIRHSDLDDVVFEKSTIERVMFWGARTASEAEQPPVQMVRARFDGSTIRATQLVKCNLTRADFSKVAALVKVSFIGCTLEHADFSGAPLELVSFAPPVIGAEKTQLANLRRSSFERGTFRGVGFVRCDLRGVSFNGIRAFEIKIENQKMPGFKLAVCDATGALFKKIEAPGIRLQTVDASDAIFAGSTLDAGWFVGSTFRRTSFVDCELEGSRWDGILDISGSKFERANLKNSRWRGLRRARGANFRGAQLARADFGNADRGLLGGPTKSPTNDLSKAIFADADLRGAKMSPVRLNGADLSGARLEGTDLSHAKLTDADLKGAVYDGATRLPFDDAEAKRRGMIKR